MKIKKLIKSVSVIFMLLAMMFSCTQVNDDDDKSNNNNQQTDEKLKEFLLSVLIDGEKITEDSSLENETAKILSFTYEDSESGSAEGLPSVTAKWEILSGKEYASLNAKEGTEILVTNTNYSDSIQSITIRLTITPEKETYKSASTTVQLSTSILAKKDIVATILFDGKEFSEKPTIKSTADIQISYSISDSVDVTTTWEFPDGEVVLWDWAKNFLSRETMVLASESNNFFSKNVLKISNVNCSGENQEVTIKLKLTPKSSWLSSTYKAYNTTVISITFIVEDSTKDLYPGSFSLSAGLGVNSAGAYDGTVKISWTESKNAQSYFVYRNKKKIASLTTGELECIDKDITLTSEETTFTYYIEAVNLQFSNSTDTVELDIKDIIPVTPQNVEGYSKKDSEGYYYLDFSWEAKDVQECEIYRLVTDFLGSFSSTKVVKEGTLIDTISSDELSSGKFSFKDYSFLDEICEENYYVLYGIVAKKTWESTNAVVRSIPNYQRVDAESLIGESNKFGDSSSGSSGSSSSSGSLSVSARKCIVYNRYSYCELEFQEISGATYEIYRCVRRSNNFSRVTASACDYIGSTSSRKYIDGDVCNRYLYENTSSSGTYFNYIYYYVEATDSNGRTYTSSVVRAD
jgi:hypothetical protein